MFVQVACGPCCRGHAHICMFQSYHDVPSDKIDLAVLALPVCQCSLALALGVDLIEDLVVECITKLVSVYYSQHTI